MDHQAFTAKLHDALQELEMSLEVPILPGESEVWLEQAASALQRAGDMLTELKQRTERDLVTIQERRPELAHQVARLRAQEQDVRAAFRGLQGQVFDLLQRLVRAERADGAMSRDLDALGKNGVAFVISVRRLVLATRTWFVEAFDRDLGGGD